MLKPTLTKLLLALFIIIPLTVFSQEIDSARVKKLSIGLSFSPDYSYRTLKPDASSKWITNSRNTLETAKLGYTTGLRLAYPLNKRVSFDAGILFSDKGYKMKKIYNWIAPNGSNGIGDPAIPVKKLVNFHYYYIDIPIKLNYTVLSTNKNSAYISASISPNVFLTQKVVSYTEYGDGHHSTSSSTYSIFNKINLSFTTGLGCRKTFSDKLFLKIEPAFRYSILSIIDAPTKEYLFSAGLDIGVYYKL